MPLNMNRLRALLEGRGAARIIEAHSGLCAKIIENATCQDGQHFDGIWVSSLTSSGICGLPDIEINLIERRLDLISDIMFATSLPVIVDADTGGEPAQFAYLCAKLSKLGVAAVIIEDKRFPKRNSFRGTEEFSIEDLDYYCEKISAARARLNGSGPMVFARLEGLIAGQSMDTIFERAEAYMASGADGLMIHSKARTPDEILAFLDRFPAFCDRIGQIPPLVVVPTTYSQITAQELFERGANIVIYANHLLRASMQAMRQTCEEILAADRSQTVEPHIASVSEIFQITGYNDVVSK